MLVLYKEVRFWSKIKQMSDPNVDSMENIFCVLFHSHSISKHNKGVISKQSTRNGEETK